MATVSVLSSELPFTLQPQSWALTADVGGPARSNACDLALYRNVRWPPFSTALQHQGLAGTVVRDHPGESRCVGTAPLDWWQICLLPPGRARPTPRSSVPKHRGECSRFTFPRGEC